MRTHRSAALFVCGGMWKWLIYHWVTVDFDMRSRRDPWIQKSWGTAANAVQEALSLPITSIQVHHSQLGRLHPSTCSRWSACSLQHLQWVFTLLPFLTCQIPAMLWAFRVMEKWSLHISCCMDVPWHPIPQPDMDSALSAMWPTWTWTSAPPLAEPAGTCLPWWVLKGNIWPFQCLEQWAKTPPKLRNLVAKISIF